jgi:1,4-dihydroxy-2-naphthoyl-CoA hydrolase
LDQAKSEMKIDALNQACKDTYMDLLGIVFTAHTDTTLDAEMLITPRHYQPMGVVHGGALISLAESVGSAASFLLVDPDRYDVFGSVVHSQHLAPARTGTLKARATLQVKADSKHVWDVTIKDEDGKLISISRVTNSVKPKHQPSAR